MDNRRRRRMLATLVALGSGLLVLVVLNFMHSPLSKSRKKDLSQVKFEVEHKKKQAKKKLVRKKKPKKKKRSQAKTLKPRMDLAFASGGIDLGIDIFGLAAGDSSLLNQGDSVMTEDIVDQLPQIQYREPIPFPEVAKEQNIAGYVTVSLLVNQNGKIEKVKLIDANPEGVFEQAALSGVQSWAFTPAEYQGRTVSVWVKQKIKFQVN